MSSTPAPSDPQIPSDGSEPAADTSAPWAGAVALAAPPSVVEEPPQRPRPIAAAAGLIVLTTGCGLVIAALAFGSLRHFNATFPAAVAPIGAAAGFVDQVQTVVRTALAFIGAYALILAITQAVLVSGVIRGNRGARLGLWVLAAFGVAGAVLTLLAMIAARSATPFESSDAVALAVAQAATGSVPGWTTGVVGMLALLQAIGYAAAAVLLAAPSTVGFFERVMRPWRPGDVIER